MFSSALKSFQSNITSNYSLAPQPSSTLGPWKIFDAKRKGTGKVASIFVFDKKALDSQAGGLGGRGSSSSVKAAQNEVLERLKKEVSSLARLRHPSILELTEPVEETRNGGLMFATEAVTASLSGLLSEKDDRERSGRNGGTLSRYVVEEADGSTKRRELEIDELEIQKGLLQIAKGLEFMHESAGLVHANLTPDAIVINSKGDWKISGLGFAGPASDSNKPSSISPISLSEVLNHDPRLPISVQLDIDFTSPDFVLDNNLTSAADMFSLGLIIIALYNTPHTSPIQTHGSLSSYKRIFSSSATVPSRQNSFLCQGMIPPNLVSDLLPRLITRRPSQRLSAKDFQQAQYFDNILVSTLRFLEEFPAKSPNEKIQFMRGLARIMPQFPSSVLEKKLLPALLEETKDRELLAPVLINVFAIMRALPSGKETFTNNVIPKLREIFLDMAANNKAPATTKDTTKEAGLMVILENIETIAKCTTGKEFRDDILPLVAVGLSSPTHAVIDASLSTLPHITPKLDYTTIKNELFPVIAQVFSQTNSLGIKIQGLEAFHTLCGGTDEPDAVIGDGLDGSITHHEENRMTSSAVLDKFTIQEKVVPLLKSIKTKEPAVMMAALKVFRQVGKAADTDFIAMNVLPILWSFSLGPLLDLTQFQAYMTLIKSLSSRIEREHTQKLRELSSSNNSSSLRTNKTAGRAASQQTPTNGGEEVDFESLVSGRNGQSSNGDMMGDWAEASAARPAVNRTTSQVQNTSSLSWSTTPSAQVQSSSINALRSHSGTTRSITPDQSMNTFAALQPSSAFSQPLQPTSAVYGQAASIPLRAATQAAAHSTINWSAAAASSTNAWASPTTSSTSNMWATTSTPPSNAMPSFSIAPPPRTIPNQAPATNSTSAFRSPVYGQPQMTSTTSSQPTQQPKGGLDRYESLL